MIGQRVVSRILRTTPLLLLCAVTDVCALRMCSSTDPAPLLQS